MRNPWEEEAWQIIDSVRQNYTMTFGPMSQQKANGFKEACELLEPMIAEALKASGSAGPLTASEALFGFAGWLTSRQEVVTFSRTHDAAKAADLVAEFMKENKLPYPRDHWVRNLVHPKEAQP